MSMLNARPDVLARTSPCNANSVIKVILRLNNILALYGDEIIIIPHPCLSLRFFSPRFLFLMQALIFYFAAGRAAAQPGNDPYRATVDSDGVQHVSILAGDYFFRPKHIIVKVNVPVMFVVRVEQGIIPHGLVLKAPEANISIDQDLNQQSQALTFTPTGPGKYAFYCPNKLLFFKSHRERGMEGVLEVVE